MNDQKGFANIVLIVVIVAIVAVGGYITTNTSLASQFPVVAGCTMPLQNATPTTGDLNVTIWCLAGKIADLQERIMKLESATTGGSVPIPPSTGDQKPVSPGQGGTLPAGICKQTDVNNWICVSSGQSEETKITTDEVKVIQSFLKAEGSFIYPTATGYYGSYTKEAVRKFQKKNDITSSGIIDQQTLQKMKMLAPQVVPGLQSAIQKVAQ